MKDLSRRVIIRSGAWVVAAVTLQCKTTGVAGGDLPSTDAGTDQDAGLDDAGIDDAGTTTDAGGNQPPAWLTMPPIAFRQGIAATFSIAPFVSDADGDALTLTLNGMTLPPGVTFDAAGKQFVYDGIGAVASTTGHVLTADDGQP